MVRSTNGGRSIKRALICIIAMLLPASTMAGALAEAYPLTLKASDGSEIQLSVQSPEGYALAESMISLPGEELYFAPEEDSSAVRFLYYTLGEGDPASLAAAAIESYTAFYDAFEAEDIVRETLEGRDAVRLDYTCAYAGRDGVSQVYEQTSISYVMLDEGRFIACIASLAFDAPDQWWDAERMAQVRREALSAIAFP